MTDWLEDLRTSLEENGGVRPYFPIQEVINELTECRSVGYSDVNDKDFKVNYILLVIMILSLNRFIIAKE